VEAFSVQPQQTDEINRHVTRNRDLLEKLIVTELVKKFLAFYATRRLSSVFTRDRYWSLSWARWTNPHAHIPFP